MVPEPCSRPGTAASSSVVAAPDSPAALALASLLSGADPVDFFEDAAFGYECVIGRGCSPGLPFKIVDLLQLLRNYDPAPAQKEHLARMRRLAAEGAALPRSSIDEASGNVMLKLWGASMCRRLPKGGDLGDLRTETIEDNRRIREFLDSARLTTADDLGERGGNWTFVVNQVQGSAPCLRDLHHGLFCRTGLGCGFNCYLTPPGAIGKLPHTDEHDVFVVQLEGAKEWLLLDATTREVENIEDLHQGDVLYMPQGYPHHAHAYPEIASLHLSVALHRSPMCLASVLGAALTIRVLGQMPHTLTTAMVEEMNSRSLSFAAFGNRRHELNQLLPARLHLTLVRAVDPEDLGEEMAVLTDLAEVLIGAAGRLLEAVIAGPTPIVGDAPGYARHRAMQQSAAKSDVVDLRDVSSMTPEELAPLAAYAFWARREHVVDQFYAHNGPREPPPGAMALADALQAPYPANCSPCGQGPWQLVPGQVCAIHRPGGTLRVNGYRLPDLSTEEMAVLHFYLSRQRKGTFRLADFPGGDNEVSRAALGRLVRVGALELAPE